MLGLALLILPRDLGAQAGRQILVLISIDGWRWDYVDRFQPPALTALAARGVRAEGLIPSFPTKTFPNHYTIITGLLPGRHGIVSNNMRDPALAGTFTLQNVQVQQDTRWWGGVPLWITAERQGQRTATMFWPGSDVEIAGGRPTYYRRFNHGLGNPERVDQVLSWLGVSEAERPAFLTLYFNSVDDADHDVGPDDPKMRPVALEVDAAIARLIAGIAAAGLLERTNIVAVSDHGMAAQGMDRIIYLEDYVDPATVEVVDWSPVLTLSPRTGSVDAVYAALKGKHRALTVYRKDELPARYRLANHPRVPPIVAVADDGWEITTRERLKRNPGGPHGNHGYDPANQSMHGLFIAAGPAFREHVTVPRFENVHVYELLCRVLGIRPEQNDGDPRVTAGFVR